MRSRLAIGLVALSPFVLSHGTAKAACSQPGVGAAPLDGAVVPSGAVTYVFAPSKPDKVSITVRSHGRVVSATIEKVPGLVPTYSIRLRGVTDAYSVDVDVYDADLCEIQRELAARVAGYRDSGEKDEPPCAAGGLARLGRWSFQYTVSADVLPATSTPVRPVAVVHEIEKNFACSYTDAYQVIPDLDAFAYRVEWAQSRRDYLKGRRQAAVVPRNVAAFGQSDAAAERASILFGHLSCFGSLLPKGDEPMFVGIASVASDGTANVPAEPLVLGPAQVTSVRDIDAEMQAMLEPKTALIPRAAPAPAAISPHRSNASEKSQAPAESDGADELVALLALVISTVAGMLLALLLLRDRKVPPAWDEWSILQVSVVALGLASAGALSHGAGIVTAAPVGLLLGASLVSVARMGRALRPRKGARSEPTESCTPAAARRRRRP